MRETPFSQRECGKRYSPPDGMRTWRSLPPHVLHRRCNSHTGTLVPLKFPCPVVVEYSLSPLGASLKDILLEMHSWGGEVRRQDSNGWSKRGRGQRGESSRAAQVSQRVILKIIAAGASDLPLPPEDGKEYHDDDRDDDHPYKLLDDSRPGNARAEHYADE
ncbi:MAG: winged helix-turn-helix transcriptional regulator [Candidatus Dadabacteria bacterium]|nr:winged helix-turn-helix transcriptional regulator [Candidatus Dadabacteria bacterium]